MRKKRGQIVLFLIIGIILLIGIGLMIFLMGLGRDSGGSDQALVEAVLQLLCVDGIHLLGSPSTNVDFVTK